MTIKAKVLTIPTIIAGIIAGVLANSVSISNARAQTLASHVCDITAFGAVPNDEALDDQAIAAAIVACAPKGGQVRIPAGIFLTGGVTLASNMELHLAGGAVLKGSSTLADYRLLETNDAERRRGLVSGINVSNVRISGSGTLDGGGSVFHATPAARPDFTLGFFGCSNVSVEGINIINPSKYHVTTNDCSRVRYSGVSIRADMLSPNSDGLQIRDSSDIIVSDCFIETGDDAIVLKSSQKWVERVQINNCVLKSDDAAMKFGTGSEPGIRHVNVSNTTIHGSRYGIALFMQDGGRYENNRFSSLIIETGGRHAREYPIFVDIDTRQPDSPAGWGQINELTFDGIDIKTRGNILIQGQPGHDIVGLRLSDISMHVTQSVDVTRVFGKPRGNRAHAPRTGAMDYSEISGQIVIGHARDVTLSNIVARGDTPADRRDLLVTRDVKTLRETRP